MCREGEQSVEIAVEVCHQGVPSVECQVSSVKCRVSSVVRDLWGCDGVGSIVGVVTMS